MKKRNPKSEGGGQALRSRNPNQIQMTKSESFAFRISSLIRASERRQSLRSVGFRVYSVLLIGGFLLLGAGICRSQTAVPGYRHSIDELTIANNDLLGDEALKLAGGPTYEFFASAMPPMRYVDARFRCYPIVLCAPTNKTKARLVSDGSSVNARERSLTWSKEQGTPTYFFMGDKREAFGKDLGRLTGPKFAEGYLPIVQMSYSTQGSVWEQESFCSTDPQLADYGVVLVKFTLKSATPIVMPMPKIRPERTGEAIPGVENAENAKLTAEKYDDRVEAWFEGPALYQLDDMKVMAPAASADEQFAAMKEGKAAAAKKGKSVLALIYPEMITNPGRGAVIAPLRIGQSAYFAIFTKNADPAEMKFELSPESYDAQRAQCVKTWNGILAEGADFQTPEPYVNNCWRAETIMDYMLTSGDAMHYSACNQYDGIYIGEGGDAIYSLAMYGHDKETERLEPAQFKSQRAGLEFHRAAFKLQMLAKCWRLNRDADYLTKTESLWQKEIDIILKGRQTPNGMLPKEQYCGDVHTFVYSLNSNSNCWRALRDMSIICQETGRIDQGKRLAEVASEYRKIILDTLDKAINHSVEPPFVPVALSGEEDPHVPIWATTMGSYWNLMIHYILASGVFPADSQTATDVLRYVENNGGLEMGMLRARNTPGNFWVSGPRVNDLYGLRRNLVLLQRDEVDKALVGFYGKLAQGMTRDTFIGCEGSSLAALDEFGRQMFLPPNSAANSNYLQTLRYMLVQDYDMNDDGKPDTLRLCFATPRGWLEDGKQIKVTNAPTNFGKLSLTATSHLAGGEVIADVDLPAGKPEKIYLRFRLPDGNKIASATANGQSVAITNNETIELTGLTGHVTIRAKTTK
jgi:hypothetical protein